MNDLYTFEYRDEGPFFLSNFGQITRATRIHGVHNEEAIDRNTEAIIAQTEMQNRESDESQVQFSGHSMMLERESNESQDIMTAHTQMQREEFNETQDILRNGHDSIKNAITAQTSAMNAKLQGVIDELEDIASKIELNTSGDVTNSNNITRAIQNLRLIVNP